MLPAEAAAKEQQADMQKRLDAAAEENVRLQGQLDAAMTAAEEDAVDMQKQIDEAVEEIGCLQDQLDTRSSELQGARNLLSLSLPFLENQPAKVSMLPSLSMLELPLPPLVAALALLLMAVEEETLLLLLPPTLSLLEPPPPLGLAVALMALALRLQRTVLLSSVASTIFLLFQPEHLVTQGVERRIVRRRSLTIVRLPAQSSFLLQTWPRSP